uniref:Long-chain acyl-CoA synthetase n=1 Tax=Kwoniella pini CBS 10737 TaxID=1296096 RepID=A0A1B9HT06_9TREE|nr:long-chain acyl-CoA synthetase [Kwoniella pini CBS 10737]OCF46395.1 long-chain acyl-CoA synthetase [Kwoniella pini CBS 10737]
MYIDVVSEVGSGFSHIESRADESVIAIWDKKWFETLPGEPTTLFELFDMSVARHPNRALFLRRAIVPSNPAAPASLTNTSPAEPVYSRTLIPTSYGAFQTRRSNTGSALLALEREGRLKSSIGTNGVSPPEITHPGVPYYGNSNRHKAGSRRGWAVGVWSKNREEWQVVDFACQAYGLVGVSLYETLGPDVAQYITNHCPLPIIFASSNHLSSLLKIAPNCPSLKIIVSMDPLPYSERKLLSDWASSLNIELLVMDELEQYGSTDGVYTEPGPVKNVAGDLDLDRERIVTVSYTSGTTGDPKGVVLTNKNLTYAIRSNVLGSTDGLMTDDEWRYISYLPLSHMLTDYSLVQRFLHFVVIHGDGTIAFTTGDVTKLLEDAQIIQPIFMAGVPRVWNRIHAAVRTQMDAGGLKGALLKKAVEAKLANWRETGSVTHPLWDALVFRKIKALLGGKLVYMCSGAAPLAPDVHEMLKICFGCDVIQGYGLTESVGTCTKGIGRDVRAVGTIGFVQTCNDVKFVDQAEMGYTSNDKPNPRGEVCLKGYNITPGYLHNVKATTDSIDQDGWFHTGDIGEITPQGHLKIVDRVKNVVKLSQGEYVALEKLESFYALDPLFASLLVHADSTRSSLVAVAVLDPIQTSNFCSSALGKHVKPEDIRGLQEAVSDKKVRKLVLKRLAKISKQHKLNGFEMIKGIHLTLQPFPDEVMTPTLKIKRNVAAKTFKNEIETAYKEAEEKGDAEGAGADAKSKL